MGQIIRDGIVYSGALSDASEVKYGDRTVADELGVINSSLTTLKKDRNLMSDAWNEATPYTKGQYVIYNNTVYKCIQDAPASVLPTNTDYYVNTTIASELTSLNNSLIALQTNLS